MVGHFQPSCMKINAENLFAGPGKTNRGAADAAKGVENDISMKGVGGFQREGFGLHGKKAFFVCGDSFVPSCEKRMTPFPVFLGVGAKGALGKRHFLVEDDFFRSCVA